VMMTNLVATPWPRPATIRSQASRHSMTTTKMIAHRRRVLMVEFKLFYLADSDVLDLGYPGGPVLAALAEHGNEQAYKFPRPMLKRPGHDFSFSGLKTAVMLEVRRARERGDFAARRADIAASFQRAAVDTLVAKSIRAAKSAGLERIVVAGGVGANKLLRQEMAARFPGQVYYPRLAYCTDNGAMIAIAGALRFADATAISEIRAQARWSLDSLAIPGTGG